MVSEVRYVNTYFLFFVKQVDCVDKLFNTFKVNEKSSIKLNVEHNQTYMKKSFTKKKTIHLFTISNSL